MVDRQFFAARMVAETRRRLAPPLLARIPDTRSSGRRPRLGLGHPRIDDNYRSTIWLRSEEPDQQQDDDDEGENASADVHVPLPPQS
jgi:hypothetical protein